MATGVVPQMMMITGKCSGLPHGNGLMSIAGRQHEVMMPGCPSSSSSYQLRAPPSPPSLLSLSSSRSLSSSWKLYEGLHLKSPGSQCPAGTRKVRMCQGSRSSRFAAGRHCTVVVASTSSQTATTTDIVEQLQGARDAIKELIKSKYCNPILVRLGWHDSGTYDKNIKEWPKCGGANGSIRFKPEIDHGANAGMLFVAGGPKIPMRYGRVDVNSPEDCSPDGNLPAAAPPSPADHLRNVFYRMGLTDKVSVPLPRSHSLFVCMFCPLPDRRLNGGQPAVGTAIVPAQPLLTGPPATAANPNMGTAAPYYSGYYANGGGGGGLGRRVSTLEELVVKINSKHEADEARERVKKEEEDRKKKEQEEEERRSKEKKDREELQALMHKEMAEKLDKLDVVREAIDGKKAKDAEELAKLSTQMELLCKQQATTDNGIIRSVGQSEVAVLKCQVDALKRAQDGASTSATISRPLSEAEEIARLRREQVEVKANMDKRLATLQEVIFALQKQCDEAEANAEVWRNEAMRPGNKRGSVAIGQSPMIEARVRARVVPNATPCTVGRVNGQLKDIVECHQREVKLLKEMRLKEVNARKESEAKVERLKEAMAGLGTGRKTGGTNLKTKLDDTALPSARKEKMKGVVTPVILLSRREAFLRDTRKDLRNFKKDAVMKICEKEGIEYTKLEETKEAIAHLLKILNDCKERGRLSVVVHCSGGMRIADQWKVLRRLYGGSLVESQFGKKGLRYARAWLKGDVTLVIDPIIPFLCRSLVLKAPLVKLLKEPAARTELRLWDFETLIAAYTAIRTFSEKRSRFRIRCLLSHHILARFGVHVRQRIVIRVKFDDGICKARVRQLCARIVAGLEIDQCWKGMLVRRMRIVWCRNHSVGDLLYNFHKHAKTREVQCLCQGCDAALPRAGQHVAFRLNDVPQLVPSWMLNSRNIVKPSKVCSVRSLRSQIVSSFASHSSLPPLDMGSLCDDSFRECFLTGFDGGKNVEFGCEDEVVRFLSRFQGLVRSPIDHNPGDTFVCCPTFYNEGMRKLFVGNPSFRVHESEVGDVLKHCEEIYANKGLAQVGRWKKDGRFGEAYCIPKHEDTTRWRPICPSYPEPSVIGGRVVSRSVNALLWNIPARCHFNLKSVDGLLSRLKEVNGGLTEDDVIMGASFDIKEMFSNLPHHSIRQAIEWVIGYWQKHGVEAVDVPRVGKGVKLCKGAHTIGRSRPDRSGFGKEVTRYTESGPGNPGGQSWTPEWLVFDNSYFKEVKAKRDEDLLVLPTDAALFEDPGFKVR
ncbi:hypothetical protein CBR_g39178 [Chara braunii]|uniref:Plant heme peroxidase family profile domain-containing protein n=1 Tax=Chara braunii TaxID=69332 RepID=A0A388LRH9_CHABU|nr:hypothetical protein CBR_g39178 [Chara braunii]|eukprot:GBG84802.1 hypothetical protein CBR_g39178 [Chara braunii]